MDSSAWQKSSYSAANDNCVEVRTLNGSIEIRESDDGEVIARTPPAAFARFLHAAKAGEFDHHAKLVGGRWPGFGMGRRCTTLSVSGFQRFLERKASPPSRLTDSTQPAVRC
ncbi:DUF397 domain-containing protein [Kitasatospora sp. NPDC054795]